MKYGRMKLCAMAVAISVALSACGGGGGGSIPSIPHTPLPGGPGGGSTSGPQGTALFSITVPKAPAGNSSVRPAYVSPNTGSIRISVLSVNGATTQASDTIAPIAYGASGCSTSTAQPLQCTVSANAPIGQMVAFRISTYASANATGSVLATSTLTTAVTASAGKPIALSLGGVVDHVVISPKRFVAPTDGGLQTYMLSVTPVDASGATIVGSGAFASPVHLSVQNDPNGALTLTQTELTGPGEAVAIQFDSSKQLTDAKIDASTGSSGTLEADFVTLSYTPSNPTITLGGSPVTVPVSESGFTGQFTISLADSTVASATISPTSNGAATITISPPPPGSYGGKTTLTVSDGTVSGKMALSVIYPVLQIQDWYMNGGPVAMVPAAASTTSEFGGPSFYYADPADDQVGQALLNGNYTLQVDSGLPDAAVNIAVDSSGNPWWVISGWPQTQLCTGSFFRGQYSPTCYNVTGTFSQANSWGLVAVPGSGGSTTLWMTLYTGSAAAIASYNTATAQFTYYTNGLSSSADPYTMTLGPDGNLWFTDTSTTAPAIGVLKVSTGAITEYPLQAGNGNQGTAALPISIVTGPDGNLWFADNSSYNGAIGKVVPSSGAITEYSGAGSGLQRNATPSCVAIGPDGNVWFTDPSVNGQELIGTVNASTGKIQEYSLSDLKFDPSLLATVGGGLQLVDSFGKVGDPFGAWTGQVTMPGSGSSTSAVRSAKI